MKSISLTLSFCLLVLLSDRACAQTGSDYYLPLNSGQHTTLHTVGSFGSGWASRTTTYFVEGFDSIAGGRYWRVKGAEGLDQSGESNVFQVIWLRKDPAGNVVMGAIGTTGSSNIDSATVMSGNFFPNEFLTAGYSRSYTQENQTWRDSVLSVTESVTVQAGTFNNCLKLSETHVDNAGTVVFREVHYYAHGVGMVKNERTIPSNQLHTDELTSYGITSVDRNIDEMPNSFSLLQNYPNPFNPSTEIQFSVEATKNASLTLYNALGQQVAVLFDGLAQKGRAYSVHLDASRFATGVYFYTLQSGNLAQTRKLMLLK